ncbi:hypothetical protein N0B31_00495 [Salinirubellus salinus]|uniref:Uncharacterized protein n=1 Tax=Salinirubellus salinus TaxID=1364945 RepID=A0A9E7R4T8_9EURY|nr:hypothetical protein [Salinirubellus salinus]UWM54773.1 hypothetical protein N0B31_00495 [Salinirubellus salinus]
MPSRRTLLTGLSGVAVGSLAGCVTDLTDTASAGASIPLGADRLAFRDGFESEAVELRQKYGDHGVWGLDGPRSPALGADTEYLGARVQQLDVPEEHGGRPFALAHGAALVYRVGERRRVWLWLAARPRQVSGRLGRTNLSRLAVETEPGPGWELTVATPRGPTREGPVAVSLDERGPSARVPLEGGGLAADTYELGPAGRVEVAWQGVSGETRAVHALVEYASTGDDAFEPPVSVRVAAARGAL